MKTEFEVSGMTCNGCVAKVQAELEKVVEGSVKVRLEYPQVVIESESNPSVDKLKNAVSNAGNYNLNEISKSPDVHHHSDIPEISITTYKPLIIIVAFITGVSVLVQYPFENFSEMLWMRHFMAGFFLVFSFFKLINIKGFSDSYAMYDIVAAKWRTWGFIYPFVELLLGVAYLINFEPQITSIVTIVVLGVSSIGVIRANLNRNQIKCACLGDVFSLPMSTVTIIEDVTMVVMAILMLVV